MFMHAKGLEILEKSEYLFNTVFEVFTQFVGNYLTLSYAEE